MDASVISAMLAQGGKRHAEEIVSSHHFSTMDGTEGMSRRGIINMPPGCNCLGSRVRKVVLDDVLWHKERMGLASLRDAEHICWKLCMWLLTDVY